MGGPVALAARRRKVITEANSRIRIIEYRQDPGSQGEVCSCGHADRHAVRGPLAFLPGTPDNADKVPFERADRLRQKSDEGWREWRRSDSVTALSVT